MSEETTSKGSATEQVLPDAGFVFDMSRAALVVIDPQNDFLSPDGAGWSLFGQSVTANNVVANLAKLFQAAQSSDMTVAVSPHYHYPADGEWRFAGPAQQLLTVLHMFERSGPLTVEDLPGSGADFLEQLKPFILDGSTVIASPHKVWGPQTNDLALQLRKRGVSQIVLAWPPTSASSRTCATFWRKASRSWSFAMRRRRHGSLRATGTRRLSRTTASSPTQSG
jgi:nicotinamidase-related amidase